MTLDEMRKMMTGKQKEAYDTVLSGINVFITGGAGTGKSYLIRVIVASLQGLGKQVLVCAPTGAAALVAGGATIHRTFNLPSTVTINEKTNKPKAQASKLLCAADTIIIDEISMCRADVFDSVVTSLKQVKKKTGKQIQLIVIGDFFQLPPIISNKHGEKNVLKKFYGENFGVPYAFKAKLWNGCNFVPVELDTVKRQEDPEFVRNLNLARVGDRSCLAYFNKQAENQKFKDTIHLFSYNKSVDKENESELAKLPGQTYQFNTIFDESIGSKDKAGISDYLVVKTGARVVITVNDTHDTFYEDPLDFVRFSFEKSKDSKFYNGSMGTVVGINVNNENHDLDTVIVSIDHGSVIMFQRYTYPIYEYIEKDDVITRELLGEYRQFPLKLAYSMTIHRSQGQTYEQVNISPDTQNQGQLYVALSRARTISGIHLDHKIQPWNLNVNNEVIDFYNNLGKPILEEPKAPVTVEQQEDNIPKKKPVQETPLIIAPKPQKNEKKKRTSSNTKGGRPRRFPDGSGHIRLPLEILEPLDVLINQIYPADGINGVDAIKRDRLIAYIKEMTDTDQE